MKLAVGLYGLYLLMVAIHGKGADFAKDLQADAPGFLPWLLVAIVLGSLYQWDKTRPLAGAFLAVAVLTFVSKNYANLSKQFAPIYNASVTSLTASPAAAQAAP